MISVSSYESKADKKGANVNADCSKMNTQVFGNEQ